MSEKFIVLDRDGVINVDLFDYVLKKETFEFENGSIEALIKLYKNGYKVVVATNQKCINLGLISAEGIEEINNFWINKIKELGGDILHDNAEINLKESYFVGDKLSDLECAVSHGCKPILVKTGYGSRTFSSSYPKDTKVFENLKAAVDWIID